MVVEFQHDEPRRQLARRIVTFRKFGDAYRRHEETHRQQLYERAAIAEILQGIGFQIETVSGYGSFRFPAGAVGFVARKSEIPA